MRHGGAVRTGGRPGARAPGSTRPDADLARCGEAEERRADQAVDTLVRAAQVLVTVAAHDPDRVGCAAAAHDPGRVGCAAAGCRLAGTEHLALCVLAHRLALLADAPVVQAVLPVRLAVVEFQGAITAAVIAVQRCRVTRHAEGRCRFSPVPGQDGCAAVLQAAHRIG